MNHPTEILAKLSHSRFYREYEGAYNDVTQLPLALRPPSDLSSAFRGKPHENPFCALIAQADSACAACLEAQRNLNQPSAHRSRTTICFAGLCETAVPVRLGERLVGFLQTGQVALKAPSSTQFKKIAAQLLLWGLSVDLKRLEDAYFHSRVLPPEQYESMVRLLEIFARHLALVSNRIVLGEGEAEPTLVRRARAFISEHQGEALTLEAVARALHVSTFYFCKMFKRATGLTFTEYLGRVRVERAKALLLNPNRRVSEVAYEVGFGSLTHFNRVFRDVAGRSPTEFRASAPADLG